MKITGATNITTYDNENLELVFSASNDLRNEVLKSLKDSLEMIFKTLNVLLVLAGIYVTLLVFIHNPQNESLSFIWPELLSGVFLVIAIFRSVYELFPVSSVPMIYPRVIYTLITKERSESLERIIPTYLSAANELWMLSEKKNFSRQQIILLISIYLINFVLFSMYCILRNYEIYLNILSIIFSLSFIIFFLWFFTNGNIKLNKLKDELDDGKNKDQVN